MRSEPTEPDDVVEARKLVRDYAYRFWKTDCAGMIFIHQGDESEFEAKPSEGPGRDARE